MDKNMINCDNGCGKPAMYKQNKYTNLCITCWYIVAKNIFDNWMKDQAKAPQPWVFNRNKVI